jgi:isopenicillin N synthase-like dioxygenase
MLIERLRVHEDPMPGIEQLPVLDLGRLDADAAERAVFLNDLRTTARDLGFFYLTGHRVDDDLVGRVLQLSREFFSLPPSEKMAIAMVNSPHFRGYTPVGWELTGGQPDRREQLDIASERARIDGAAGAPAWARLQGPNQWPRALPQLKPVLQRWQQALTETTTRLLRAFALALEQPADIFDAAFAEAPIQHVKIIRYPGRDASGGSQGVGPHKDNGFLTFVLQDPESESGLRVETDSGWIDVPPKPGTFVVNIGESLEMVSNGYLRATTHQVVSPASRKERLSVAFFLGPRLDATLPRLVLPAALASQARGLTADPRNPLLFEVGLNMLKGRLRSHPDVARRHYSDLEPAFAGGAGGGNANSKTIVSDPIPAR